MSDTLPVGHNYGADKPTIHRIAKKTGHYSNRQGKGSF